MATTVKPLALKVSATCSMLARPPPRPCRKITIGEHLTTPANPARRPAQSGAAVGAGRAISTLMLSFWVVRVELNAPVIGSIRLKVVIWASMISAVFVFGTAVGSTPYLENAAAAVPPMTFVTAPVAGVCCTF